MSSGARVGCGSMDRGMSWILKWESGPRRHESGQAIKVEAGQGSEEPAI
jgi:hypothetical protein